MTEDTNDLVRLLLHKKPVKILLSIAKAENTYPSQIAKEADCTFPHTLNILNTLEENNIIESTKTGRKKEVKLTSHGVDIAHDLAGLVRHLKGVETKEEETTGAKEKGEDTTESGEDEEDKQQTDDKEKNRKK